MSDNKLAIPSLTKTFRNLRDHQVFSKMFCKQAKNYQMDFHQRLPYSPTPSTFLQLLLRILQQLQEKSFLIS